MEKERLMSILIEKNNDYFRGCHDITDSSYIYDAQINTARKIVMQLASNVLRTNHVMLLAPMQSGKTATCISVVNIINKSRLYKSMAVNKFLFITGMNDCGLKTQTYERVKQQVIGATDELIYHNTKSNIETSKYFVLKNSDLMLFDKTLDNSVIFIDEAHYGSNEKNVLTQFFYKHGVDWKNTNELIKRNIYIVSVSATPFDELVSDRIQSKKMVELDTDSTYVGVSNYLNKDVVFNADKDDIQDDGAIFDYIMDADWRMEDNNEVGIIFIRTRNFDCIKNNKYVQDTFDVVEMYSSGSRIQYDKLNSKMEKIYQYNKNKIGKIKPLIILIKGAYRAGITIDPKYKDIIYMVYDYSIKADTTAQALLGRMCGYRPTNSKIENTYFYLNKKFADMYSAWENDFQNKNLIPCDKTDWSWVSNDYQGTDVKFCSRPCGNFAIPLNDDEVREIYSIGKGKRNRAKLIENRFNELLEKNGFEIKYDYINEVQISGKNRYAKSSQEKRFNSFSDDSLVFQFRPEKMKQFVSDTNRDYLTRDDVGKRCVSIVLDAEVFDDSETIEIKGNKRLLVYYVEVGQKQMVLSRKGQYKPHKDTEINE